VTPVVVVDAGAVPPRRNPETGLTVRATLGPATGFDALEQAVLELPGGRSEPVAIGEVEETLYVLEGAGTIEVGATAHELEPDAGIYLPRASRFVLENTGPGTLRLLAVRIPDPSPGPPAPAAVRRLTDQPSQPATASRAFRVVAGPETGLRSATQFVGEIPVGRAPDHFHTYDEAIYVLSGEGVVHAGGVARPVSPGSCIQLPARTVHCLENTGQGPLRVLGVFRPAGSPASAFYPDGTPA